MPAELLSCRDPAVPGNDLIAFVDQDRIYEAKSLDRGGDFFDLSPRMGAGVPRIRLERGNGNRLRAGLSLDIIIFSEIPSAAICYLPL